VRKVMAGGVSGGDLQGDGGQGDGAGAGAYVENAEWFSWVEFGEDGFDEVFGLGARDEDGGSYEEVEAIELLMAGDVLDGLLGDATLNGVGEGGLLGGGERTIWFGVELGSGDVEGVEQEQQGIALGGAIRGRDGFELRGGGAQGVWGMDYGDSDSASQNDELKTVTLRDGSVT
jgi:hypothetical protein